MSRSLKGASLKSHLQLSGELDALHAIRTLETWLVAVTLVSVLTLSVCGTVIALAAKEGPPRVITIQEPCIIDYLPNRRLVQWHG